jgi:hypothetical protein
MITKCVAFLVAALVLANCCALGGGCAPLAGGPGGPVALDDDGLGGALQEAQRSETQAKRDARPSRKSVVGSRDAGATRQDRGAQPKDQYELEQAADQADDLRLKRKLTICSDCMPSKSARDDAMSSSR